MIGTRSGEGTVDERCKGSSHLVGSQAGPPTYVVDHRRRCRPDRRQRRARLFNVTRPRFFRRIGPCHARNGCRASAFGPAPGRRVNFVKSACNGFDQGRLTALFPSVSCQGQGYRRGRGGSRKSFYRTIGYIVRYSSSEAFRHQFHGRANTTRFDGLCSSALPPVQWGSWWEGPSHAALTDAVYRLASAPNNQKIHVESVKGEHWHGSSRAHATGRPSPSR